MMHCPLTLAAQNGITITNFSTKAGSPTTVTFNVQWVPLQGKVWSDTAWVFVDYNNAGTMTRLPLSGATLTAHSAPGVGKVVEEGDNDKGVWVVGNARDEGSFSATVQLRVETWRATSLHGLCVYAINYPPVGQYTAVDKIKFTGTPPFYLTYSNGNAATVTKSEAQSNYILDDALKSFTDASRAPGTILCKTPVLQKLIASATSYCANIAGVMLALQGTEAGAVYRLYKDNSALVDAIITGVGAAATFTNSNLFGAKSC